MTVKELLDGDPFMPSTGEGQVGWFCSYTPLELISAFDLTPVRIFGSGGETEIADSLLHPTLCPYVRSCLELGLEGKTPRALVFTGCCDSLRRLYDAWRYYCDPDFTFILDVPRRQDDISVRLFRSSVRKMVQGLQDYTGESITRSKLTRAIRERRALNAQMRTAADDLSGRKRVFSCSDYYRFSAWAQVQDPGVFLRGGRPLLDAGDDCRGADRHKPMLLTGSIVRPGGILEIIEECGGRVVALDLCSADRLFLAYPGEESADVEKLDLDGLLDHLARMYLSKTRCPRMTSMEERCHGLTERISHTGSRGVIHVSLMFCDPFLFDYPRLKTKLNQIGVHTLSLLSDYRDGIPGQLRTRVEAFLEMI